MSEYIYSEGFVFDGSAIKMSRQSGFRERVTRCADCAHCKQVRDGSGLFCELWRHRTRADGYCHMGEVGE